MSSSANGILGTAVSVDSSTTTTDSNNYAQSNTVASGNGETVYGFKMQLSNSSVGDITTSDFGSIQAAFGLAKETVDNANTTYERAAALDKLRANPLELLTKPLLVVGGLILGFFLILFLFGRKKRD